jgi:hypothetical protein
MWGFPYFGERISLGDATRRLRGRRNGDCCRWVDSTTIYPPFMISLLYFLSLGRLPGTKRSVAGSTGDSKGVRNLLAFPERAP